MAIKSMHVLNLGTSHIDESKVNPGVAAGTMIDIFYLAYLIQAEEGNILVDAGFHPEDASRESSRTGATIDMSEAFQLPNRLAVLGLTFDDIAKVVMTHLHNDHVGYLNFFTKSEIFVQREESLYAAGPSQEDARRYMCSNRFNSKQLKWQLIDGDVFLQPGVAVMMTPGHTPGCQSVIVNLPETGPVLLVGDTLHEITELDTEKARLAHDQKQATYSIKRLKALSQLTGAPMFPYHVPPIFPTEQINVFRSEMFKTEAYR